MLGVDNEHIYDRLETLFLNAVTGETLCTTAA